MDLLKIELLKIKKFKLFSISIITSLPAIVIAISLFNNIRDKLLGNSIMEVVFRLSSSLYVGMLLNLFIIYLVCTLTKIESLENGWRGLLVLPIKRGKLYMAKLAIIFIIIAASLFSYYIFTLLATVALGGSISLKLLLNILFIFIAIMPLVSVLYVVARNAKSIVVPLLIGIFFTITGFFIVQSKYWIFAPWTYAIATAFGVLNSVQLFFIIIIALILSAIVLLIDFRKFTTMDFVG